MQAMFNSTSPLDLSGHQSHENVDELLEAAHSESEVAILHRYATFVCSLIMCGCCAVGVFGNTISLLIFTRRCMRSPINVLLAGLALVDLCLVAFAIPVFVTPGIGVFYFYSGQVELDKDPERLEAYNEFVNRLYNVIVFGFYQCNMIANTSSVWTCVVICGERYFAVCKPFVSQRYSTVDRAKAVQISVFLAAIGYNFIRFFEYEPDDEVGFKRRLRNDTWYIYIYYTILYLITHFIVPFCLILGTNVLILRALRRAHNVRRLMMSHHPSNLNTSSQRIPKMSMAGLNLGHRNSNAGEKRANAVQQHQTSHVIVVVTIMFTLCNSLSFILCIWEAFELDLFAGSTSVAAFFLLDISNVLVVFNSASTFLFYLRYCTKYRKLFMFYCASVASRHPFCKKRAAQMQNGFGPGQISHRKVNNGMMMVPVTSGRDTTEVCTPISTRKSRITSRSGSLDTYYPVTTNAVVQDSESEVFYC